MLSGKELNQGIVWDSAHVEKQPAALKLKLYGSASEQR